MGTERCVTRILSTGGSLARFKPLSPFVDERDGRHWHIEKRGNNSGDPIKPFFRFSIEEIKRAKRSKPRWLVFRDRRLLDMRPHTFKDSDLEQLRDLALIVMVIR